MLSGAQSIADKLLFRFEKLGRAALFSHHDLMRLFTRAVERADLPVRKSAGFNPRPRIVFPHALGLGIASRDEAVEVEFAESVEGEAAAGALGQAVQPLLRISAWQRVTPNKRCRTVDVAEYRITVVDREEDFAEALCELRQSDTIAWTDQHGARVEAKQGRWSIERDGAGALLTIPSGDPNAPRPMDLGKLLACLAGIAPDWIRLERIRLALAG